MAPPSDEATLPLRHPAAAAGSSLPALARAVRRLVGLAWRHRWNGAAVRAFALGQDGTMAFRPGRDGLALSCLSGVFLVTQQGDPEDHVLEAGGAYRTGARGRVVAWAFRPGVLVGPAGRRAPPPRAP